MTLFLKKLGLFFILLLGVSVLVFGFQTWTVRKQANFKFSKNYKYLMLGHSHPECAYNDSLIANFKNAASSGESYFYTFYKLKKILEQNNDIETVLIEFTNNQVNAGMDNWIWGDKYISKFYPKYGSFLDFEDTCLLMKHNLGSLLNNFSVLQKKNLIMGLNDDYNFIGRIGGYVYYKENNLKNSIKFQNDDGENKIDKNKKNISEMNILYLEKMIALCKSYGKEVVFIRSPQHASHNSRNNETKFLHIYSQKFSEVPLLDLNDFEIPDGGFKDLEHLNYKGAQIISKKLDSLLKHGIPDDYLLKQNKRMIISN